MSFVQDFKKFAFKGNVVDLAVGVIIGGAFGKIVSAMVSDIVMPVVGLFMPRGDWRQNGWTLRAADDPKDAVILHYGDFLGAVLDFFIIAGVLFILVSRVVRAAERTLGASSDAPVTTRDCPACLEKVPKQAIRCRACTSELTPIAV